MPLKITFIENEIADYLRVDPGDDPGTIAIMKDAAIAEAYDFLNNDFSINTVEVEAPAAVKEWVLNRIVEKYENRGKAPRPDFTTIKTYRVYPFRG